MLHSTSIDFLIRIKNASLARRPSLVTPFSNFCLNLAKILKKHSLIADYSVSGDNIKTITVNLAYLNRSPVIKTVKIFSKPGRRWYEKSGSLPWGDSKQSLIIVSTSTGLLSCQQAVKQKIGGEIVAQIN
jgi:small subunit ribosomal protein S8